MSTQIFCQRIILIILGMTCSFKGITQDVETLNQAVIAGNLELVEKLIAQGAEINEKGAFGWTPLMSAASKDHYDIARYLLLHKADVNMRNAGGFTSLMWAINKRNLTKNTVKTVQLLIEYGSPINAHTCNGQSALSLAEKYDHTEIIEILRHETKDTNDADVLECGELEGQ